MSTRDGRHARLPVLGSPIREELAAFQASTALTKEKDLAPWWLHSSKDEGYEDELESDDTTLESLAIGLEPTAETGEPADRDEEAFSIGWEPGQRSAAPPSAVDAIPPARPMDPVISESAYEKSTVSNKRDSNERDPDERDPDVDAVQPARKRRRRRRKKQKTGDENSLVAEASPRDGVADGVVADSGVADSGVADAVVADVGTRKGQAGGADGGVADGGVEKEVASFEASTQEEIAFDFGQHGRSATGSDERKIGLFCDLENIALGVRNSETKKFDINLVIERLLEKGKIIVKKAYADWERYSEFKRAFHEAAIELIDIPQKHYSGKNSADIKMVVDAMDLCFSKDHLDTFVILSGDSDFSPLVSKLKENNKYVIGVGVKGSTSGHLIDNCDEFIYYEDVWRDMQRTPRLDHLSAKEGEVFGLLIDAILALLRENKSILWGSMIKQTMKRKRPSFSEGYYGYNAFRDLLQDAHEKDVILLKRDKNSGNYVVTGFGP